MFKSPTVSIHLLRGVLGLLCFGSALSGALPVWAAVPLVGLGLFALRGCPMCWLMGLAETVLHRRQNSVPAPVPVMPAPEERELAHAADFSA